MCIQYTTFRHIFHHCWGTCHSVAPVFVPLHRRIVDTKQVVTASVTSDTILWRSDREIWGKCRESGVMVNLLFSLIFSSTARTKSSFATDGRPLRGSLWTFSRHTLNSRTHLLTIELLKACSPYTSQSWRWISVGVMFFAFKKWITDRISHEAGFSIFFKVINTQRDA